MRKRLATGLGLILAIAVATSAGAATSTKPRTPRVHSVSGTVASYDAVAHTLVVKGTKANWTFDATDAQAWKGTKSVALDELTTAIGFKVKVKYTQKDGQNYATTVRVDIPKVK